MNLINVLVIILVMSVLEFVVNAEAKDRCANVKAPLGGLRKKRYLTFPPGTNLVLTMSLLKTVMTHAPSGWNVALEIDVVYPMASQEMLNKFFRKQFHHRQKREIWETIDNALSSYNLNGRSCIYRSICEARMHLAPPGKSLVHDILRTIFTGFDTHYAIDTNNKFIFDASEPDKTAPVHEADFKMEVDGTYNELLDPDICERMHDCPISLLEAILSLNKNNW